MRASVDGRPVVFKLEHLQLTGSFKVRGAVNKLLDLNVPADVTEVVTASGGNHGIAVAQAAQLLGAHATVFVPVTAPEAKTVADRSGGRQADPARQHLRRGGRGGA